MNDEVMVGRRITVTLEFVVVGSSDSVMRALSLLPIALNAFAGGVASAIIDAQPKAIPERCVHA